MSLIDRRIFIAPPGGSHMLRSRYTAKSTGPSDYRTGLVFELWGESPGALTNVGGKASAWADSSAAGVAAGIFQATAANRPVITAGAIGGKIGVTFGPTAVTMQNFVANLQPAGAARYTIIVAKATSTVGGYIFGDRLDASNHMLALYNPSGSTLYTYNSSGGVVESVDTVAINGVEAVYEFAYAGDGTLIACKQNGVAMTGAAFAAGAAIATETGTTGFMLGEPTNFGAAGFIGHVGLVRRYLGVPSAGNQTIARNFVASLYGITVV